MKIIRTSTIPLSLNVLLKGQLNFLSNFFDVIGISSCGEDLKEVRIREGIRVEIVNMERGINPLKDLISLFYLYKQLKKERPLIIHSITPKAGLLTMIAGKMAGVPIRIHTFTGLIFPTHTGFMQKLLIKMDQLLCWASTNIYPEGNGVKNDLVNYRITSKPLKVLANGNVNGIDLDFFSISNILVEEKQRLKQILGIPEGNFVFVFVGRLVVDKGITELVEAFSKSKFENTKLLLVGSFEPELDPLQSKTLKEIESNPNIISVGFQKDVRPYFAISNCLVFPSYREGFPNVVMQAGALELPSIVTDISGCNEIIVEGKNGTIIPVKNTEAILQSMQKMRNESNYYSQLQKNARHMITERYEQKFVWNALLKEYKSLINNWESKKK